MASSDEEKLSQQKEILNLQSQEVDEEYSKLSAILPWDKFSNWINCMCVITFDLELGQAMELIYPGHIKLTEREKSNICYLSFPDSNSGCMGDTQFSFRIRQCPGRVKPMCASHINYNHNCPVALQIDPGHYFGYVYFRQVRDHTLRRGYFQKSVVIISRLPFHNLFMHMVGVIAPEYFDNGEPSIEVACHDIDQWPTPEAGATLNLPLMGTVLQVRVPSHSDKPGLSQNLVVTTESAFSSPTIMPSVNDSDVFKCLFPILPHIQLIWELVLTGEPVVVMANSPTVCSETVLALVSMILPLRFCSDYRQFFTIHDSEFKEYTSRAQAPPPVILGVTNPFFAKTLQHWPHIVRIGDHVPATSNVKPHKLKKGGSLKTLDSKPGVYTRYKPFLNKDKAVLKRLVQGIQTNRPSEVQSAMLRRHFLEVTQSFMIPLERYVASLMPLLRNISPYKGTPRTRPFDPDEFLKSLDFSGPQLTTGIKGDWIGLYRRFFRCANFEGWYNTRIREVNRKLQLLHLEAMSDADLQSWVSGREEVEVVDLILKIKEKLTTASSNHLPVSKDVGEKLYKQMDAVIYTLPEDLRAVLGSN
ncbi:PREDICTED: protein DENND6A-like [Priapulus caudatus]|uniref:Protein DENND6A-like n=1 Tax=Priapulus caudatus TaxID=37621 RepID=A0ABM1ETZ9_PRICU|nr:PREDICTED: protein DENND6A-like [Priapulus caudatus]